MSLIARAPHPDNLIALKLESMSEKKSKRCP